ncbi:MAG: LysE family transporter [Jatrophihabitans sp.]|uniref:LysE family transporter n=1 Tax=Jatrophihabitans sp. TaxID=1932789 RepID=UPI003F7DEEE8
MIADLGAGLLAGLGVALPLGPIGALLMGLPATAGARAAAAAALGVSSTDALYATLAVVGGASAARAVHPVARPLGIVSALVLLALAGATLVHAHRRAGAARARRWTPPQAYLALLALTAVNPATLAYFAALVLGTRVGGVLFVVGVLVASAAWQLVLVGGGAALAHRLTTPGGRTALAVTSAAVMLLAAARALVQAAG